MLAIVVGSSFLGCGSRSGVPGSIAVGSGAEVGLEARSLGGDRLRRSTFALLTLALGFRGGSGAHGRRGVSVGAGGSDWVLQPLGIAKGLSVGPTKLDLGGKGGHSKNGCDCECVSHCCADEDNICIIILKDQLFIPFCLV